MEEYHECKGLDNCVLRYTIAECQDVRTALNFMT